MKRDLEIGDFLLIFTDGVLEAEDEDGQGYGKRASWQNSRACRTPAPPGSLSAS
jgi:serine phosphatase RsbU (regulator of sigma subunit)